MMSASAKPDGSLTPLVLANSSHKSSFCILSPTIWVRCTVAGFSLQAQHNIKLSDQGHFDCSAENWAIFPVLIRTNHHSEISSRGAKYHPDRANHRSGNRQFQAFSHLTYSYIGSPDTFVK